MKKKSMNFKDQGTKNKVKDNMKLNKKILT